MRWAGWPPTRPMKAGGLCSSLFPGAASRIVATGRGEPLHELDAARRYLVDPPEVDGVGNTVQGAARRIRLTVEAV